MPSKALLWDVVVTLGQKTRRSMASKSEGRGPSTPPNGPPPYQNAGADGAASLRPPSYRAIADGEPNPPKSVSPERVDVPQPGATPASNQETNPAELNLAASLFPPVPSDIELSPLPKPVLIPSVNPGPQIPFARAWAPELANHAVTPADLVAFVDHLNRIITPQAVVQMVALIAVAISVIPYEGADGIAGGLEGLAILAAVVMSHKRRNRYLERVNEKYFHPRKLHVKITNSKKMIKRFGLDKEDPLVAPLSEDTLGLSAQERCLRYVRKWTCELSFDVPPPSPQTGLLARIAAWEVRRKISKADDEARKSRQRAWKRHQKGKKLKESWGEKSRARSLDWILIQNLDEWEAARAEKQARKQEKKKEKSA
ncbi:hypothetical protein GGS23DRAFT_549234 [Durotheca rogersii]|uniref:uncharacterized protein n=1 Tax=Durotheca rogersii TaxID=419775 RepID=UPI00221E6FC5|nr:uncharacterized protein GGS23DRAFT_549234 [Durotheca rogersii]KAI5867627.1 hypothetical protein GGS23DRAFT_549234 [Durotheca rogersii]